MTDVLIPLKTGTESQPVFLAHGMGGGATEFLDLVKFIRTERSVYGLQAKGNDGVAEPFKRIEDLARYYLDAIKKMQPSGPYFLAGFSLGGLVALEMAQQLSSGGEIVALLAMLESYPHPTQLALAQRIRLASRAGKRRISAVINPTARSNQYLKSSAQGSRDQIASAFQSRPEIMQRARDSAFTAWKHYQPRFYQGKIYFAKAEVTTIYPDDPVAVWGNLANEIETQTVPGDHHGILITHFEILGSVLSRYLRDAAFHQLSPSD